MREKRVSILEPSKEAAKEKEPYTSPDVDISRLTAMNDTVVENTTEKSIDFNAQLQHLKKRTESELPHTLSQVEDSMYLD